MLMCNVTKTPHYTPNLVYSELLLICKGDVSIRFSGNNDNVMLE